MNELVVVKTNEDDQQLVSGRELHEFLEIGTQYTKWFERMSEYGFEEMKDYILDSQKRLTNNPRNPYAESKDHLLTIDMAKEVSMIQRTKRGKEAREYFIQVEKAWNNPEMVVQRALQIQTRKVEQLKLENEAMKPKAVFADAVAASPSSILIGELAKFLNQNGVRMGQNQLFEWMRDNNFLIKRRGSSYNLPTQYSMDRKLFEIKEKAITRSNGNITISKTTVVTGKGQQYFINKFIG